MKGVYVPRNICAKKPFETNHAIKLERNICLSLAES